MKRATEYFPELGESQSASVWLALVITIIAFMGLMALMLSFIGKPVRWNPLRQGGKKYHAEKQVTIP